MKSIPLLYSLLFIRFGYTTAQTAVPYAASNSSALWRTQTKNVTAPATVTITLCPAGGGQTATAQQRSNTAQTGRATHNATTTANATAFYWPTARVSPEHPSISSVAALSGGATNTRTFVDIVAMLLIVVLDSFA
ncbi:hypothetical protein V496_01059 [Pseudogymnoascus sp. VKM F-4515 (FW-2607)]|nr:hypothetical protein V496_01059 [Pseudogymnoascus sp. VKM F-4515 (FW-2607)]KFY95948.1 hypothetical protein V498_03026 [Pseudogymnoascus sp. VKM F-4517 (FW-2822)]